MIFDVTIEPTSQILLQREGVKYIKNQQSCNHIVNQDKEFYKLMGLPLCDHPGPNLRNTSARKGADTCTVAPSRSTRLSSRRW